MNAHEQQYLHALTDDALAAALAQKGEETPEFMRREDALRRSRAGMQAWHAVGGVSKCTSFILDDVHSLIFGE